MGTRTNAGRLGLVVGMKAGRLVAVQTNEGSPAHRVGIQPGDHIVRIHHEETAGLSRKAAAARLRGPAGEAVTIWIARPGTSDLLRFDVVREEQPEPLSMKRMAKPLFGLAGALLVVTAIVMGTFFATSPHRKGAQRYASLLREARFEEAHALLTKESKTRLPYDDWRGTMGTTHLSRATDVTITSSGSRSMDKGCVGAVVIADGRRIGLTFFTWAEGDDVRIHAVMTNEELSGFVDKAPWRCD